MLGFDREPLTYAALMEQAERTVATLNRLGAGRGDRVAIVLPNGPEMAVCCYAVACAATSAPLNPVYSRAEFEFFLSDLRPRALITSGEAPTLAAEVARSMGLPVWLLEAETGGPAGAFRLEGGAAGETVRPGPEQPEDTALVLHTSGSTARPKMVPLSQANLCASAHNIARSLSLTPEDRCLSLMPLFHIHGLVGSVLSTFASGGSLVATPGFHPLDFYEWMARFAPTWYTAVPTMHQAIVSRATEHRAAIAGGRLRFLRSCSSALPPNLLAEVERTFGVPLVEAYGMTEASHQVAINPLPPEARKPGSVGRAAGCEIVILDERGEPRPAGEVGEVAIRGANVTPGYENNPEANRAAFANGWFRTGDLGRLDHEQYLFLTGRSKEIINRGGEKISPREVDEALLEHPAVAAALTFALPDPRLGEEVGAAIVVREGVVVAEEELAGFAAQRLADFKVPRRFVFLKELPKGPTGKPQRIGLAEKLGLTATQEASTVPYVEPRTEVERGLAAIWKQALRRERAGVHDNFFSLGGDSVLAMQVIVRVRERFQVTLPTSRLFASPVLEQMARWIEAAAKEASHLSQPIGKLPRDGPLPLSYSQQRMWFLAQFEDTGASYVVPTALRLRGGLNVRALEDSLRRIVERHETLRTVFVVRDGAPLQRVLDAAWEVLSVEECPGVPEAEREEAVRRIAREEAHRRYDLSLDRPLRGRLIRFAERDHLLLVTVHHIASDGWSKALLFTELEALYSEFTGGGAAALPSLGTQYADYARWQRSYVESAEGQRLADYWKKKLAGAPELLDLPYDRPRPARQTFGGGLEQSLIPAPVLEAARRCCRDSGATLYMTLLAAWLALLSRYSGQTDICVGSPVANRIRKEAEDLIGAFINTLAMRADLKDDPTFQTLVRRVRQTALEAYDHQDLPLEKLIEILVPHRSLSYSPLFQVLFQLRNFPEVAPHLEGIEATRIEFDPGTSQFDLYLETAETREGLACWLTYNSALFDTATARRILGHYRTLLESALRDPQQRVSRLPILSGVERRQVLLDWNQTAREYPRATALELFEERARRGPGIPAVEDGPTKWTYGELDRKARAIAGRLREAGAGRGTLVGVCVERGASMLAALLGIWKAGAAYVPLDPAYPRERLDYILEHSGAVILLTQDRLRSLWTAPPAPLVTLEECADSGPPGPFPSASLDELAYMIYTSGSTGRPKGVPIRHQSLTNLLWAVRAELEVGEQDVFLAITTISFDIAAVELFLPLVTGARVYVATQEEAGDVRRLAGLIARSGASVVQATPSHWRMLVGEGWKGKPGLKILSGGEALAPDLAGQLLARGRVWNGYGPTETTIYSTVAELVPGQCVAPIGKPIANTQAYVLDANGQPLPVGVPGELHLGGDGRTEGYWRQDDLTAERFVANPVAEGPDARLYKTGDLVRYLPDGNLEYLGRLGNQVKVRGFRIELEEVESVLRAHPGVRSAVAKVLEYGPDDRRLAVFYTSHAPHPPSERDLRQFLRSKLPGYMTPSELVPLAELPLTPNGKVDRKALRIPPAAVAQVGTQTAQPADITEMLLLHIWEEVLNRRPIRRDDDFFELGGHSLLGARLLARVESVFGRRLTLIDFFQAPTVARMAEYLRTGVKVTPSYVIPVRSAGEGMPLYVVHPSPIFRSLLLALPNGFPVYLLSGFDAAALPRRCRLEDIAAIQAAAIDQHHCGGPLVLAGWCLGGVVALEMARRLRLQGSDPLVVMIDCFNPARLAGAPPLAAARARMAAKAARFRFHMANLSTLPAGQTAGYLAERWRGLEEHVRQRWWQLRHRLGTEGVEDVGRLLSYRLRSHEPALYDGPVLMFRALRRPAGVWADPAASWRGVISELDVVDLPGNHNEILTGAAADALADALGRRIGVTPATRTAKA